MSRGEPRSRSRSKGCSGCLALALAPLFVLALYFGGYLVVRGSHLLVHRHSIVGRFHRVEPGGQCLASDLVCFGATSCWTSGEAIPSLFAPLVEVEEISREVADLLS